MNRPTIVTVEYYISTGRLNAMYTLRRTRAAGAIFQDDYICNLAGADNEDRAVSKATDYFNRMFDRIGGNTDTFRMFFNDSPENTPRPRRGKLSVRDTAALEAIEAGRFPFGKHAGTMIADAPASYVLYWADCTDESPAASALSAACAGVALEKGYIAARDQARAERAAVDALSQHIGTIGERREFAGVVVSKFVKLATDYEDGYTIVKVRCGNDLVTYWGNGAFADAAERDQPISFKATIKAHKEYKGVNETAINRPAVI